MFRIIRPVWTTQKTDDPAQTNCSKSSSGTGRNHVGATGRSPHKTNGRPQIIGRFGLFDGEHKKTNAPTQTNESKYPPESPLTHSNKILPKFTIHHSAFIIHFSPGPGGTRSRRRSETGRGCRDRRSGRTWRGCRRSRHGGNKN